MSARLFLVSDVAGALEPCGCVKDQLGGMDHVLAFVAAESKAAPSAMLAAGPLFFMDPKIEDDRKGQDQSKAETLAAAFKQAGLLAFAPAENDHALGDATLDALAKTASATMLHNDVVVRDLGGVKLGVIGVTPDAEAPEPIVKRGVEQAKAQGARAILVLASIGRGPAKRIADAVPELTAILVGQKSGGGDANTETPPGERVGDVLIAETGNHLQTVAVLDLHVRDDGSVFADASNLEDRQARRALDAQIKELRTKIALVTQAKSSNAEDPRQAELEKLLTERSALDHAAAPASGSFFRYRTVEMRESVGQAGTELLRAYYKKVNDANKLAFADRKPTAPEPGQPAYVGIDACVDCHESAKKVWDKTAHAHAYKTLTDQFKEFNLDCVSCHVTGYERPGGSTVTAVKGLTDVQCEVCHGPGSKHTENPKTAMPVARPGPNVCASCHHPPHVHAFDAPSKLQEILGPGHGRPLK